MPWYGVLLIGVGLLFAGVLVGWLLTRGNSDGNAELAKALLERARVEAEKTAETDRTKAAKVESAKATLVEMRSNIENWYNKLKGDIHNEQMGSYEKLVANHDDLDRELSRLLGEDKVSKGG